MFIYSIKTKLIFLILIVLIPLTVLQAFRINSNYKHNVEAELEGNYEIAEIISLSFMNYLEEVWAGEKGIGVAITANDKVNIEEVQQYLDAALAHDRVVTSYSWISPQGKVLASTDPGVKKNSYIKQEYFKGIQEGKEKVISNLFHEEHNGRMVIAAARAIKKNNQIVGAVVGMIDINKLYDILSITNTQYKSRCTLLDKNGIVIFINEDRNLTYEKRISNSNNPALEALKGQVEKTYRFKSQFDGSDRLGISYPIKEIGWAFVVTSSYDELVGVHKKVMQRDFIILSFVAFISYLFAVLTSKRLVDSIQKLKNAAEQVSKGDFDQRIYIDSCDELQITSEAFNQMSGQISKLIRETEKHNELKSQFFITISHELKTPLNIILGTIQLVDRLDRSRPEEYDVKQKKYLGIARQNSYRLLRLINNLIDLNKLEGNHLQLKLINEDIIGTVEDITLSVVEYAESKKLDLVFDTELEERIMAFDPDMIERIMLNLISNAIKFTGAGGSIFVNIYDMEEKIIISVKDTGIGIPLEMHHQVFEYFVQVDNSLQRKTEGSGIGLSLVKSLVELHGGTIEINSEYTEGCEFVIELPVNLVEEEDITHERTSISNVERINIEFSDIYI